MTSVGLQADPVAPFRFERYKPTWDAITPAHPVRLYKKIGVGLRGRPLSNFDRNSATRAGHAGASREDQPSRAVRTASRALAVSRQRRRVSGEYRSCGMRWRSLSLSK